MVPTLKSKKCKKFVHVVKCCSVGITQECSAEISITTQSS